MAPSTPQFTPGQVLQAGRRAEADGKLDLAEHFYRHVVGQYGATAEAALAREALIRLGDRNGAEAPSAEPDSPPFPAAPAPASAGAERAADGAVRRDGERGSPSVYRHSSDERLLHPTEHSRRRYRIGRIVGGIISAIGWTMVLAGVAIVPLAVLGKTAQWLPLLEGPAGLAATIGWAVTQSFGGLLIVLLGQVARAIFDVAETGAKLR